MPSATFECAACGRIAARVSLVPAGSPIGTEWSPLATFEMDVPGVRIEFNGSHWKALPDGLREPIARALEEADAGALFDIARAWFTFYCGRCRLSYCVAHWSPMAYLDEGAPDFTTGTCPEGHGGWLDG